MARPRAFASASPGDIVWRRFPEVLAALPGPKPRPALVIACGEVGASPAVEVAYGTSRKIERLHPGEFLVGTEDGEAWTLSGLSYPTKFDLSRRIELPFDDRWFAVAPGAPFGQHPKMGLLHPVLMRRASAAYRAAR